MACAMGISCMKARLRSTIAGLTKSFSHTSHGTHFECQWCEGGTFRVGASWAGGETFNYPEQNCCECGGRGSAASPPPPPPSDGASAHGYATHRGFSCRGADRKATKDGLAVEHGGNGDTKADGGGEEDADEPFVDPLELLCPYMMGHWDVCKAHSWW